MDFVIKISDNYNDEYRQQEAWSSNKDEEVYFSVCDLSQCPEDAIIGRDLFTVDDFIEAIELGFRIAKKGYNEIVIEEVSWREEEE